MPGPIGLAHRTTWRDPLFHLLTLLAIEGLVVVVAIPLLRLIYSLVLVPTELLLAAVIAAAVVLATSSAVGRAGLPLAERRHGSAGALHQRSPGLRRGQLVRGRHTEDGVHQTTNGSSADGDSGVPRS